MPEPGFSYGCFIMSAVWIAGNTLLVLILFRATRADMLRRYRVFYVYVGFVLCSSLWHMFLALTVGKETLYYEYYIYYESYK